MDRGRRRLGRNRGRVDYARLHGADVPSEDEGHPDLGILAQQLLEYAGYAHASCPEVAASEVTEEYIHRGLAQPALVPASATAVQQLGMVLPPATVMSVPRIAEALGYEREVATLGVATQAEGPRWNLVQWLQYWCTRQAEGHRPPRQAPPAGGPQPPDPSRSASSLDDEADSRRDVKHRLWQAQMKGVKLAASVPRGISAESGRRLFQALIPLASTPLEDAILPPRAARESDLAERLWQRQVARPGAAVESPPKPNMALQLSMAPAGCFANFRLAAGGATTWVHVISGNKVFALLPPSPENLAIFAAWASSARRLPVFLAEHAHGAMKAEVPAGATLFIPAGWAYAEAMPADSVALCGAFLHGGALRMQAEVTRMQEQLALAERQRLPQFYQVMWLAAAEYAQRLRVACGLAPKQVAARTRQLAQAREREAATPVPKARPMPRPAPEQAAAHAPARAPEGSPLPLPRLIFRRRSLEPAAAQPAGATNGNSSLHSPQLGRRLRRISQRHEDAEEDAGGEGMGDADADAALADNEWPEEVHRSRRKRRRLSLTVFDDKDDDTEAASDSASFGPEPNPQVASSSEEELTPVSKPRQRARHLSGIAGIMGWKEAAEQPQQQAQLLPKLRLKLSDQRTAAAQAGEAAGAPSAPAVMPAKLGLKLRLSRGASGAVDKGGARQVSQQQQQQPQPQPERQGTLKLRLKLGESGGLPQVDGAADNAELHQEMADETAASAQPEPHLTDGGVGAIEPQLVSWDGDAGQPDLAGAGTRQSPGHGVGQGSPDASRGTLPVAEQQPDSDLPDQQPGNLEGVTVKLQHTEAAPMPASVGSPAQGIYGLRHEGGHPDLPRAVDEQSIQLDAGRPGLPAKNGETPTVQPCGSREEGAAGMPLSGKNGAAVELMQPEQPPQQDNNTEDPRAGHVATNGHAAEAGSPSGGGSQGAPGPGSTPVKPLSAQEQEGLPALLAALRAWLKRHGSLAPVHAGLTDPERLLDEMEVCMAAMGLPTASEPPVVDFMRLPQLHLPDLTPSLLPLQPHRVAAAVMQSDDVEVDTLTDRAPGSALQTEDKLAEEALAQEELGDSTLEAQARGRKRKEGVRAAAKKKPTVRDRLLKKLRMK